jgi:hypothetical protein
MNASPPFAHATSHLPLFLLLLLLQTISTRSTQHFALFFSAFGQERKIVLENLSETQVADKLKELAESAPSKSQMA